MRPGRRAGTTPGSDLAPQAAGGGRGAGVVRRLPALGSWAYRRLLTAYTIGTIGGFMYSTAQGWLVLSLTNSPGLLAVTTAAQNIPNLVFSVVGGALADQVDRRRLLVSAYVTGAVFAAILALLTMGEVVAYWHVVVLAFLGGASMAVAYPAQQSILPTVVDRAAIGNAIALNSVSFNIARIAGPAVAGVAIAAGGLVVGFWANAIAFVVVATLIGRLPLPAHPARVEAGLWTNLLAGFGYVRAEPMIALLVVLAAVPAIFVLNLFTFLPVYARDILQIGPQGLGMLLSAVGVGAIVGAVVYAVLLPGGGSARLMLGGLGSVAVLLAVFAWSTSVPLSLAALALYGASQVGFYSTVQSLLQTLAAPRMRGRVMSLYMMMALGVAPIGNVLSGVVAETWGVQVAVGGGGLVTLTAVAATWFGAPRLRALHPGRIRAAEAARLAQEGVEPAGGQA